MPHVRETLEHIVVLKKVSSIHTPVQFVSRSFFERHRLRSSDAACILSHQRSMSLQTSHTEIFKEEKRGLMEMVLKGNTGLAIMLWGSSVAEIFTLPLQRIFWKSSHLKGYAQLMISTSCRAGQMTNLNKMKNPISHMLPATATITRIAKEGWRLEVKKFLLTIKATWKMPHRLQSGS